jgi:hypothetical protein
LQAVREAGATLDLDGLQYFSRWITPTGLPRRWDTRFYLARAPEGAAPSVDGAELLSWEWVDPLVPPAGLLQPTRLNLARLAESADTAAAIAAAAGRERTIARPVRLDDGTFTLPSDAGYDDLRVPLG